MENNKNILKKQNGSVALIVLFSMVFMVSYMLIMYASNINREKTLTEQTEFIKDLYSPKGTNEEIYERAYANLREKNKKIYSQKVEESNTIELKEKTYGGEIDELKIYGSGYEQILPSEYQEVEYIESTGTQYIDTGYNITENFKYYVNVAITDTTTSTNVWPMIMGTQGLSNASDGKYYHLGYTPSTKTIQKKEYEINVFYNLEFSRVWNGEPCGSVYIFTTHCSNKNATDPGFTSKCKLKEAIIYDENTEKRHFIPCYRKSDNVIGMYDTVEGKFYINQGTGTFLKGENVYNYTKDGINSKSIGTLVDNVSDPNYGKYLVPIKITGENEQTTTYNIYLEQPLRKYGDTVDYLDIKTKKVYRNVGFDGDENICELPETLIENVDIPEIKLYEDYGKIEILTENNVSKIDVKYIGYRIQKLLPDEYQGVEYIESTGTQYIDTGYFANQDTYIKTKVIFGQLNRNQCIYCSRNDFSVKTFSLFMVDNKFRFDYNSTQLSLSNIYLNEEYYVYTNKNKIYINDLLIGEISYGEFKSDYSMLLLMSYTYGQKSTLGNAFYGKMYFFKIYDNDKLVRNFIPCYRISDNVIGMYDTVEGKFYTNQGTGKFLKGPDKEWEE